MGYEITLVSDNPGIREAVAAAFESVGESIDASLARTHGYLWSACGWGWTDLGDELAGGFDEERQVDRGTMEALSKNIADFLETRAGSHIRAAGDVITDDIPITITDGSPCGDEQMVVVSTSDAAQAKAILCGGENQEARGIARVLWDHIIYNLWAIFAVEGLNLVLEAALAANPDEWDVKAISG